MNTAKVFSTANGNLISITDVDAAGGTVQVQLVSTNGATTLSTLTGLSFSVGDGAADATMTFTGPSPTINAALSGLTSPRRPASPVPPACRSSPATWATPAPAAP